MTTTANALADLLAADENDGLLVGGRSYRITHIGTSRAAGAFRTREFTLDDDDFYLVLEGDLLSGDPGKCRAILTHELSAHEVTSRAPNDSPRFATAVLRANDLQPAEVHYQNRPYRFGKRTIAEYSSPSRSCQRVTWDYEFPGRNVAIERWPEGEMAVYEGQVVPLDSIRVLPGYAAAAGRARPAAGSLSLTDWYDTRRHPVGIWIGAAFMAIGGLLLIS